MHQKWEQIACEVVVQEACNDLIDLALILYLQFFLKI